MPGGTKDQGGGAPEETRAFLHNRLPALRAFFAQRAHVDDIDDMVQDVALRLHICSLGDTLENGRAYLYQVARSVVIDQQRRRRTRACGRHLHLSASHEPIEERCPERVLKGKQELALALQALNELPERTMRVFKLHRFERVSHAAIAADIGISVSAVEKHIMRATRHMESALAA